MLKSTLFAPTRDELCDELTHEAIPWKSGETTVVDFRVSRN